MTKRSAVSIGIAAAVGPDVAAQLAPAVEAAGFHALWVNDTPGADALAVLEAAARTTRALTLATGVVPVDRRPASEIVAAVIARGLPQDRLMLGIGSGGASSGVLQLVTEAAAELRDALEAKVVLGALGPKMRRRAVRETDGVVLSWLPAAVAAEQAAEARAVPHPAATPPHVALYVRTALDIAAAERLHDEMRRYSGYPSYAANFARLGATAAQTVLDPTAPGIRTILGEYRAAADEVVLRAITPGDEVTDYLRFVEDAKALL